MRNISRALLFGAALTGMVSADDYSGWKEKHPDWVPMIMDDFDGPTLNDKFFSRFDYYQGYAPTWFRYQSRDEEIIEFTGKGTATLWGRYGKFTSQNDQAGDKDTYACGGFYTRGKLDFQYGYVEVRARFDNVQGTWPAIWMVPSREIRWPMKGEVDILEHVNDQDIAHQNLHSCHETNNNDYCRGPRPAPTIDNEAWNTYGMLWEEGKISFFLNGKCTWECPADNIRWPFDMPGNTFYLIVDQQIGGMWCENLCKGGIDRERLATQGAAYEIDYVHIYTYPDKAIDTLTAGSRSLWSSTVGVGALNKLTIPVQGGEPATLVVDGSSYVQNLQIDGGTVEFQVAPEWAFRARSITLLNGASVGITGPARLERLEGDGKVSLATTSAGDVEITASESPFAGTLDMTLGGGNIIIKNNARTVVRDNAIRGVSQAFEPVQGKLADWELRGAGGVLVVDYGFTRGKALQIGKLAGSAETKITGAWGSNVQEPFRYIAVQQDSDSVFSGSFVEDQATIDRSVGLIKRGKGTLTLTGNNTSHANLEVEGGCIALQNGAIWSGAVLVFADAAVAPEGAPAVGALVVFPKGKLAFSKLPTVLECQRDLSFAPGAVVDLSAVDFSNTPAGHELELVRAAVINGWEHTTLIPPAGLQPGESCSLQVRPSRTHQGLYELILIRQ